MEKIKRTYKGQALHESTLHELIDFTLGLSESAASIEDDRLTFTKGELAGSYTDFVEENDEIKEMHIYVKEKTYATRFEPMTSDFTVYKNEKIKIADITSPFIVRRNGVDVPHEKFELSEDGTLTFHESNIEEDEITVHSLVFDNLLRINIERDVDGQIKGWEMI